MASPNFPPKGGKKPSRGKARCRVDKVIVVVVVVVVVGGVAVCVV